MVSSIPNYAQEFFCSTVLFLLLGRVRRERAGFFWTAFFIWPIISLTMNLGYWDRLNIWSGADLVQVVRMMFLVLFITVGGLGYDGGWVRCLYCVLISDVLMTTLTIATAAMYALLRGIPLGTVLQDPDVICSMPMILFKLAVFFALIRVCYRPVIWVRDFPFERFPLLRVIAVLVTLCMVNPVVYQMSIPEKGEGKGLVAFLYVAIAVCTTLVIIFYIRAESIRQQNMILQRQLQLQDEYRGILVEQQEMARKLRHDIRRHIQTLTWASERAEQDPAARRRLGAYRSRMQAMADQLQMGNYSGDPDVDAMLYALEQHCREHEIPWECRLQQADFSILPEETRRDLAFMVSYWAVSCLQDDSYGNAESCEVYIRGGCLAGRSYIRLTIRGRRENEDRDKRIRVKIEQLFKDAKTEYDISFHEEKEGICLQAEWC